MKKIIVACALLVAVLIMLAAAHESIAPQASCGRCNVVLISIDTLAARQTSPYDPALDTMPYLKKLAAERGIVFERAYAQAPWTLPSHAAMLTGEYPWDLGVWEFLDAVPERADTLAEKLARAGYRTALFSNGSFVQPEWQFDQGFEETHGSMAVRDWNDLPGLFDDAAAWIGAEDDAPYFAFVRPFEAHDPYRDGTDIGEIVAFNEGAASSKTSEAFRDAYRADLKLVDAALERFISEIGADDTIVIVTSDHGEEFGEHGTTGLHGTTVYDESIHVPLIMLVPGIEPKRVGSTVETRSVPATVLDFLGIPFERSAIGPSLARHARGETASDLIAQSRTRISRDELLGTIEAAYKNVDLVIDGKVVPRERAAAYAGAYAEGIMRGPWKLMRAMDGTVAVFDRASDPGETRDAGFAANALETYYLRSFLSR